MEDALAPLDMELRRFTIDWEVLILVLMEDALARLVVRLKATM